MKGNKICDKFPTFTAAEIERHNDCYEGMYTGLHIYNKGTAPYKTGFVQGRNDSQAGFTDGSYCYREFVNVTQSDQCWHGYNDGNADSNVHADANVLASLSGHHIPKSVAVIRHTSVYRLGWTAGVKYSLIVRVNDTATYDDPCSETYGTSRDFALCELGYTDGQDQTPFNKAKTYSWGFHWRKLRAEGKASGDRAGDCGFDLYIPLKQDICKRGWDIGWDSIKHKHIDVYTKSAYEDDRGTVEGYYHIPPTSKNPDYLDSWKAGNATRNDTGFDSTFLYLPVHLDDNYKRYYAGFQQL